jgi:hypothetical protein
MNETTGAASAQEDPENPPPPVETVGLTLFACVGAWFLTEIGFSPADVVTYAGVILALGQREAS